MVDATEWNRNLSAGVSRRRRPAPTRAGELLRQLGPPMQAEDGNLEARLGDEWLYELKYDGFHLLAAGEEGQVALASKNGKDLEGWFPALVPRIAALKRGVVLDGEVVSFFSRGRRSHHERVVGQPEHCFVAFDLLWVDGQDLRQLPLEERRARLEDLLTGADDPMLQLAERLGEDALAQVCAHRFEGVIAKRRGSRYVNGPSKEWLKLKPRWRHELAAIGFAPRARGDQVQAVLLGAWNKDRFDYVARLSKLTDEQRAYFAQLLAPDVLAHGRARLPRAKFERSEEPPREEVVDWVRPRYFVEVEFPVWLPNGPLQHVRLTGVESGLDPRRTKLERASPIPPPPVNAGEDRPGARIEKPATLVFSSPRVSRADLAHYYRAVAPALMPVLKDRALEVVLYPQGFPGPGRLRSGAQRPKAGFRPPRMETRGRPGPPPLVVSGPDALIWLVNAHALELRVSNSRDLNPHQPDWLVFQLEPASTGKMKEVVEIARLLRAFLRQQGLLCFPKTSGRGGLDLLSPLAPPLRHAEVLAFARTVAAGLAQAAPAVQQGLVHVGIDANAPGGSFCPPYAPRALEDAPVSTPLRWSEVGPELDEWVFTVGTLPDRLSVMGDLFARARSLRQRLVPI